MLTLLSPLHASLTLIAFFILYLVYLLVIKPVTLIRYYERQGALGEYYPILGGYGKRVNEANITGDWLSFYKKDVQNSKGAHKLFATNILGNAFIFLVDPDLIKDFISNQEKNYKKAEEFIDLDKFFLGTGVATSEGEVWKKHRKIASSAFHFDFIKSTVPIIEQVTQEIFDAVAKENMSSVDIMDVMQKITGEITGRLFFGNSFATVSYNGNSLPKAITETEATISVEQQEIWANLFGLNFIRAGILPHHKRLMSDIRGIRALCKSLIAQEKEKQTLRNKDRSQEDYPTLLERLLGHQEKAEHGAFTDDDIVDDFLTFFLAGTDTTGHLLTMVIYYLVQNPKQYQKTLEEVKTVLQSQQNLTYEKVEEMVYTLGVLKETLRLASPTPFVIPRQALNDHNLKDLHVKKGTRVLIFTNINGANPEYFENPTEFNPERWLAQNEADAPWRKRPFAYLPFSSGARNCIGQHLALLEGKIILAKFLERFEMALPEGYKMKMTMRFLYEPIDPLMLILNERK